MKNEGLALGACSWSCRCRDSSRELLGGNLSTFPGSFPGAGKGLLIEAGVGAGASLAGEEVAGGGTGGVLEGEATDACFFFSRTGGTARPISSKPALVLLAPVSSYSGGEVKSSVR
jgi:hypothetical protein